MGRHSFSFLFLLLSIVTSAQTPLQVINDSVRITNAELIIRNSTKDVQGYLYNSGNGVTQFKVPESLARRFYVAAGGDDNADGLSPATSWKTINKVNSVTFLPGDVIAFKSEETFTGKLVVQGGSGINPITYTSYGGSRAILQQSYGSGSPCISAVSGKFILKDLIVRQVDAGNDWASDGISVDVGYSTSGSLSDIVIENCEVSGFGGIGIVMKVGNATSNISNIATSNCVVYECMSGINLRPFDGVFSYKNVTIQNSKPPPSGAGLFVFWRMASGLCRTITCLA